MHPIIMGEIERQRRADVDRRLSRSRLEARVDPGARRWNALARVLRFAAFRLAGIKAPVSLQEGSC